jgi:hypothetical protein
MNELILAIAELLYDRSASDGTEQELFSNLGEGQAVYIDTADAIVELLADYEEDVLHFFDIENER